MEMPEAGAGAGAAEVQAHQIPGVPPSSNLRAGWLMPPFFHELPLDAPDADTAAERLYTIATTVLPDHSTDDQYAFALLLAAQVEPMAEGNVISAGMCFLEAEGKPTASTVQVAQLPHESQDNEIIATLLETLRGAYPRDEVEETSLPCGPAVTRIGPAPFAVENTETGEVQPVHRNVIQTYVPMPGTSEMLLFELGVFSAEGWDLHSEVFAEILKTIDWASDEEVREAQLLATQSGAQASTETDFDEGVKAELRALSEQLENACADAGQAHLTREDERLSGVTCPDCWAKGLRSACVARYAWRADGTSAETVCTVLPDAATRFEGLGWQVEGLHSQERLVLCNDTHTIVMSTVPTAGSSIHVEVTSPCTRLSNTAVADDFG